jgi:hypothetical protein
LQSLERSLTSMVVRREEDEVVDVVHGHHPARARRSLKRPELVLLEVECRNRSKTVLMNPVPDVVEAVQKRQGRLNIRTRMPLLDLDENRRVEALQRFFTATQHSEFVPLDVALDEIKPAKQEIIKPAASNLDRVVLRARAIEGRETIRGSSTDLRDVQVRLSGTIRESNDVHMSAPVPPRYRTERGGVFRVRLERVDNARWADEPREQRRIGTPAGPDVEDYISGANQLFGNSNSQVTQPPLPCEVELRAQTRGCGAGEADRSADQVDETNRTDERLGAP